MPTQKIFMMSLSEVRVVVADYSQPMLRVVSDW
jgi:hypothetical protein